MTKLRVRATMTMGKGKGRTIREVEAEGKDPSVLERLAGATLWPDSAGEELEDPDREELDMLMDLATRLGLTVRKADGTLARALDLYHHVTGAMLAPLEQEKAAALERAREAEARLAALPAIPEELVPFLPKLVVVGIRADGEPTTCPEGCATPLTWYPPLGCASSCCSCGSIFVPAELADQ